MDMMIRREILFTSSDANEINKIEPVLIREYNANDPDIGYNQWPKFKR